MEIMRLISQEHIGLRKELNQIANLLADTRLENALDLFITHLQTHERLEQEFLVDKAAEHVRRDEDRRSILNYEKIHSDVFELLHDFRNAARSRNNTAIQLAFIKFSSFAESHFSYEEEWLFPMIRHNVPLAAREAMAEEALSRKYPQPENSLQVSAKKESRTKALARTG